MWCTTTHKEPTIPGTLLFLNYTNTIFGLDLDVVLIFFSDDIFVLIKGDK